MWLETRGKAGYFICCDHWKRVPRYLKRRRTRLSKLWQKRCPTGRFWDYPAGSPERLKIIQIEHLIYKTWVRCLDIASGRLTVHTAEGEIDPGVAAELRGLGLL